MNTDIPTPDFDTRLTRHAGRRMQQRAAPREIVELVDAYADIALPLHDGCVSRMVSHDGRRAMLADGVSPQLVDRAQSVHLVCARDSGEILTVVRRQSPRRRTGRRRRLDRRSAGARTAHRQTRRRA